MNQSQTWMRRALWVVALLGLVGVGGAWGQDQLNVPEIVDNGASVLVTIGFSPALTAGDSFFVLVNNKQVLAGNLANGSMTNFSTNVIADSNPTTLAIGVSRGGQMRQATRSVKITSLGSAQSPDTTPIAASSVRIRQANQTIRMLFSRDSPFVGSMTLSDSTFSLRLISEGGLSKSSYFSAGGNFSDILALAFGQGSSTQQRDDPKVFGRGARGS